MGDGGDIGVGVSETLQLQKYVLKRNFRQMEIRKTQIANDIST